MENLPMPCILLFSIIQSGKRTGKQILVNFEDKQKYDFVDEIVPQK
jgi:hypothetical protein